MRDLFIEFGINKNGKTRISRHISRGQSRDDFDSAAEEAWLGRALRAHRNKLFCQKPQHQIQFNIPTKNPVGKGKGRDTLSLFEAGRSARVKLVSY